MKSVGEQRKATNFAILYLKILTLSSEETVPLTNQLLYVNRKLISLAIH